MRPHKLLSATSCELRTVLRKFHILLNNFTLLASSPLDDVTFYQKPYAEVEYVELDPRVYKSDYNRRKGSGKPEPMPRKKHSASYASIDTTHNNNDLEDSRLI